MKEVPSTKQKLKKWMKLKQQD